MRITNVEVKHFRSIRKIEVAIASSTVFAGPNSSGKSNILRAIRFAFVDNYSAERAAANFPVFVTGPAAEIFVSLVFDEPSPRISAALGVPAGTSFSYGVAVRRNGKTRFLLNGNPMAPALRQTLIDEFQIVFVPPIRDIGSGGLDPLKGLLGKALRNARGGQSISALNNHVRAALVQKGNEVLHRAGNFGSIASVGGIAADADSVDIAVAIDQLNLQVRLPGAGTVPLSALGTGHQSQVVMNLYGGLGASFPGQVIYMFEEPDNHLHPSALLAVAGKMREVVRNGSAQILVSSHSAPFVGSFRIDNVIVLESDGGVTQLRKRHPSLLPRRVHSLMSSYGLRPIDALLSKAVILVEGPSDVSVVRGFAKQALGIAPEEKDVLLIQCGGKKQVAELHAELIKLGVRTGVVLDGDAAFSGSPPCLGSSLSAAQIAAVTSATASLRAVLNPASSKMLGTLQAIEDEAANGAAPRAFSKSPVESVAKASGRVNAVSLAQLGSAFLAGRRRVWKRHLGPAGVWVWKEDAEAVLAILPNAQSTIRAAAVALGVNCSLPATATPQQIRGWLHNQASEPDLHEAVCAALLASSPTRSGELWEFVAFLRAMFG